MPLFRPRRRRGAAEKPEETRVRQQHQPRVVRSQCGFVGLHGTIKRVELRVLPVGLRENPGAIGIAVAARLLALLRRVGELYDELQGNPSPATRTKLDFLEKILAQADTRKNKGA